MKHPRTVEERLAAALAKCEPGFQPTGATLAEKLASAEAHATNRAESFLRASHPGLSEDLYASVAAAMQANQTGAAPAPAPSASAAPAPAVTPAVTPAPALDSAELQNAVKVTGLGEAEIAALLQKSEAATREHNARTRPAMHLQALTLAGLVHPWNSALWKTTGNAPESGAPSRRAETGSKSPHPWSRALSKGSTPAPAAPAPQPAASKPHPWANIKLRK